MATIKSHSDLQQSKKLAEILPIESADMYWWSSGKRYYIEAMDDGDEHTNFLNKIQIGDKVTRNEDGVLVNLSQLNRVAKKDEKQGKNNMGISEATKKKLEDNLNKALQKETPESWNKFLDEQGEQNPTIEMKTPEESLGIDSDTYNKIVDECIYGEQKTIKEHNACEFCEDRYGCVSPCSMKLIEEEKPAPQTTWKPSGEQMLAINTAINVLGKGTINGKYLIELQEQLKKLREE